MRTYTGAVLFVDILGIGALTKATADTVTKDDFAAFDGAEGLNIRNQVFCAVLLARFRRNLRTTAKKELHVAQLSDCAFVWSADVNIVVEAARALFWRNLQSGLLCRAGMTYGEIVEPDSVGKSIGDFVCGEAVTRAVDLERTGKGARVFIDRQIGGQMFSNTPPSVFQPISSGIDFRTVDEYLWFAVPPKGDVLYHTPEKHIISLMDAAIRLRCAPQFRWNAVSNEGRLHVGASIERMAMFAKPFCEKNDLPFPEFAFVTADMFMEFDKFDDDRERDGRKLAALNRMSAKYQSDNFSRRAIKDRKQLRADRSDLN